MYDNIIRNHIILKDLVQKVEMTPDLSHLVR